MNLSYELIVACIVNLIAVGVAFGSLRTKLEAQDRMLVQMREDFDKRIDEMRQEMIISRNRMHELSNRIGDILIDVMKMRRANDGSL